MTATRSAAPQPPGPVRQRKGRAVDPIERERVAAALHAGGPGGAPTRRDELIEALHRLQDRDRCLRHATLVALADLMRLSYAEVHEVATFYHHFDVIADDAPPPARVTVRVCDSIACALAGAQRLLDAVTCAVPADVRVVRAPCIGRCDQAPAVCVGRHAFGPADAQAVTDALRDGRTEAAAPAGGVLHRYLDDGGYRTWRALVGADASARPGASDGPAGSIEPMASNGSDAPVDPREHVFSMLDHSGLRGLGGAGFPTGRKWRLVAAEPAPRLLVVNIDEGEPGTFKDRHYLEADPHRFVEGMLIAAWAIEAQACWIYLRDEYHDLRAMLAHELDALAAEPPGGLPLPPIVLRRGAGAYICGEESALIESLEGRRGMPRLRPPYVAQAGLFGRPTLVHNLETLWWVRDLLERGPQWFAAHGRRGRRGLRSFSVSGRVRAPGVKLAPAGITLAELIDEHCGGMLPGHTLYGYLPGGASGGILPARLAEVPLDFDTLAEHGCFIGSAAVVVLSQHDRATDVARNLVAFFRDESCGKCTPCRAGTARTVDLIRTEHWDRALLGALSDAMADASICGLGQAAPNPVRSVMRHFAHELQPEPEPLPGLEPLPGPNP